MRHCHLLAQLTNESDEIIQSFTKRIQPQKLCLAKQKLAIECGDRKGVVPLPTQIKERFIVTIWRLLTSLTARCQRWGEGYQKGHTPPGKHYRVRDKALESALFFQQRNKSLLVKRRELLDVISALVKGLYWRARMTADSQQPQASEKEVGWF